MAHAPRSDLGNCFFYKFLRGCDGILAHMDKLQLYGLVACGVGAAALITGLLPQAKMDRIRALLHEHFGRENAKVDERVSARLQLIVFGAFFLFLGLLLSGLIRL
jgi:hypothetical protein